MHGALTGMPKLHPAACAEPCRSRAGDRQQPDGDDPTIVVAPKMLPSGAKLGVPIDVPAHVVSERIGGATVMSGLMPGAVAPDGTVASLKSGAAAVLLGVSRGTGLPTKALVSVELLARDRATDQGTGERRIRRAGQRRVHRAGERSGICHGCGWIAEGGRRNRAERIR